MNFVVVMTDTQYRDMVGAYGNNRVDTPHLDRLAASGTRFDRAYTTCPLCTPARSGIFTGTHSTVNGAWANNIPPYGTIPSMGTIFRHYGYRTAYTDYAGEKFGERALQVAATAWAKNRTKHDEICATLQDGWWGYGREAKHIGAEEVLGLLAHADDHDCDLLLKIGPLLDGSVHPDDVATLKAVGQHVRTHGWPEPSTAVISSIASSDAPPIA